MVFKALLSASAYGIGDDTAPTSLTNLSLFDPKDKRSKDQGYWAVELDNLLDEGWRLCYTDGTGGEGKVAAGVFTVVLSSRRLETVRQESGHSSAKVLR